MDEQSLSSGELMQRGERLIGLTDTVVGDFLCITEFVAFPNKGYAFADCPLEGKYVGQRFWTEFYETPDAARLAWNNFVREDEAVSLEDVFGGVQA